MQKSTFKLCALAFCSSIIIFLWGKTIKRWASDIWEMSQLSWLSRLRDQSAESRRCCGVSSGDSDWSSKVWAVIRSNQTCIFFSSTAQIACAWMYEYNVSLDKLRLQLRLWGISVPEKTSNYIPISTTWRWSYKRLLLLFFNIVLILVCQECVKDSFNDSPRGKVPHYYSNSLFISLKLWDS